MGGVQMADTFGRHRSTRTPALLKALGAVEAPQSLDHDGAFPIVISAARGARVKDADQNRYLDMTSFFGACLAGHRHPAVIGAARKAIGTLAHTMGDVFPDQSRGALLKKLQSLMPAPDYKGHLSLNGADAVETALKFAAAYTGRGGVISFEGAYHGLSAGALEVTWRPDLKAAFAPCLSGRAVFAPWPATDGSDMGTVLSTVEQLAGSTVLNSFGADIGRPGALIVEPIQGRGGVRVPPPGFLSALRDICSRHDIVFIADEIYCGCFRTGTFLASESDGVAPDIVCLGKALGGGFPISVAMMRGDVAAAVASSNGEAVHTSTFMGWPVSCQAAIASIVALERMAPAARAGTIEARVRQKGDLWVERFDFIQGIRGRGAMLGIEVTPGTAMTIAAHALQNGVIVLPEGCGNDVVALTPPLPICCADLDNALKILEKTFGTVQL